MDIKKYVTKKNVMIGAAVGTAIVGGVVALVAHNNKKKKARELEELFLDDDFEEDDYDEDYDEDSWVDDLDDEWDDDEIESKDPELRDVEALLDSAGEVAQVAQKILERRENCKYGA